MGGFAGAGADARRRAPETEVIFGLPGFIEPFEPVLESAQDLEVEFAPDDLRRWDDRIAEAEALLESFDLGDSFGRVVSVQGEPDEYGYAVLRYGSSVVYFNSGVVTGWVDGSPRLRVRRIPDFPKIDLDLRLREIWSPIGQKKGPSRPQAPAQ